MKVLIVDEMHESIVQMPVELGLEVDYFPNLGLNEVAEIVEKYDGLIIRSKFSIDESFLQKASRLKFIGRAGAGLDLIDLEACKRRDIAVFAANEANRVAVAEHLIGMILALFNKIHLSHQQVKEGIWLREENRGEELFGKTVGVVGTGLIGAAFCKIMLGFGCKVIAFDVKPSKELEALGVSYQNFNDLITTSDIISLHCPLNEQTNHLMNATVFNNMKPKSMWKKCPLV